MYESVSERLSEWKSKKAREMWRMAKSALSNFSPSRPCGTKNDERTNNQLLCWETGGRKDDIYSKLHHPTWLLCTWT